MMRRSAILRIFAFAAVITAAFAAPGLAAAAAMRLEFEPQWAGIALRPDFWQPDASPSGLTVTRMDYLLSGLALRREDGSWLESQDWFAFLSLDKGRNRAEADSTPKEKFTAIRFSVGVPPAVNAADPSLFPADHALNPGVCGLHWGWQGGYIFMALEGRWRRPDGQLGGYSFHLANNPNLAKVELPVPFQGGGPLTVKISLDVGKVLAGIDFQKDGDSTHSREGDALASRLRANLEHAFRVEKVSYDLYQPSLVDTEKASPLPPGAHPYPLAVTQRFPQVRRPVDNPLTLEGVALGEKLFHDPRLSVNSTQSCASCHDRGAAFADKRRFSAGANGDLGKRNAMPLFNLAWGQTFFWDGRAKTLREQVLMPIQDAHEMNEKLDRVVAKLAGTPGGAEDFNHAFGSPEITAGRIALALEQYLLTLVSQESRFDQAARKTAELTQEEKRGLQLFVTEYDPARGLFGADCFHCHGGTLFTDHQFKNNGLDLDPGDVGRMLVTGRAEDKGKFKTPSLRNVALTAPYMHDGRFKTLEEVVAHYNGGVKRSATLDPNLAKHPDAGLQLSAADQRALVAFLKTLTDEGFTSAGLTANAVHSPSPPSVSR